MSDTIASVIVSVAKWMVGMFKCKCQKPVAGQLRQVIFIHKTKIKASGNTSRI